MSEFGPNPTDTKDRLVGKQLTKSPDANERRKTPENKFSIDRFTSKFLKVGLITPSNFFVKIAPPNCLPQKEKYKDVGLFCAATSLPGRRISTTENRPYGYGQVIKMPYDVVQDDIELTFYVDAQYASSLSFFTDWMNSIIDPSPNFPGVNDNNNSMRVKYKIGEGSYLSQISIYVLSQLKGTENPGEALTSSGGAESEFGYSIIECKLHDAYPIQISPVQLDWGDGDQFMRVNITFAFRTAEYSFGEAVNNGDSYKWVKSVDVGERKFLKENREAADLLTSIADFVGSVKRTSRTISRFKTNFRNIRNARGFTGNMNALIPLVGYTPEIQLVNQIVSDTRFIKSAFKRP